MVNFLSADTLQIMNDNSIYREQKFQPSAPWGSVMKQHFDAFWSIFLHKQNGNSLSREDLFLVLNWFLAFFIRYTVDRK